MGNDYSGAQPLSVVTGSREHRGKGSQCDCQRLSRIELAYQLCGNDKKKKKKNESVVGPKLETDRANKDMNQ